jgi:hypothetical protein
MRRRADEYARRGCDEQLGLCALPAAHGIVGRMFVWARRLNEVTASVTADTSSMRVVDFRFELESRAVALLRILT